jgi:hypothetical protein
MFGEPRADAAGLAHGGSEKTEGAELGYGPFEMKEQSQVSER